MNKPQENILCYITDQTFDPGFEMSNTDRFEVRKAARGILMLDGKIALLNVFTKNFHKLPGGGIEKNETIEEAFLREVLEETGCNCEIVEGGGVTVEHRNKFRLTQISYVFMAKVVGEPGTPKLDPEEIAEGHDLEWFSPEDVQKLFDSENPQGYSAQFIHFRDKAIFEFYKDRLTV